MNEDLDISENEEGNIEGDNMSLTITKKLGTECKCL